MVGHFKAAELERSTWEVQEVVPQEYEFLDFALQKCREGTAALAAPSRSAPACAMPLVPKA